MSIFHRNSEIFLICAFFRDWGICAIINVVWCRCFGYVGAKMFIFYSFLKCAQNFCENSKNFQEFGRVYKVHLAVKNWDNSHQNVFFWLSKNFDFPKKYFFSIKKRQFFHFFNTGLILKNCSQGTLSNLISHCCGNQKVIKKWCIFPVSPVNASSWVQGSWWLQCPVPRIQNNNVGKLPVLSYADL